MLSRDEMAEEEVDEEVEEVERRRKWRWRMWMRRWLGGLFPAEERAGESVKQLFSLIHLVPYILLNYI